MGRTDTELVLRDLSVKKPDVLLNKFIVGVTGGIGSGKTAVTDRFIQLGIDVVDADIVAREVVAIGSKVLAAIEAHFGREILLTDGSLDRAKLRTIIFTDVEQKKWLNQLMHPAIRTELIQQLSQADSVYVILSAPLLLENNLQFLVDKVLSVDVPEKLQVERASLRDGVSAEQIQAIIESQITRELRLQRSDEVIDNSGDLEQLQLEVDKAHQRFLQMS